MPSDEKQRVENVIRNLFGRTHHSFSLAGAEVEVIAAANESDDCAILQCKGEFDLVLGSDYVRGTKFSLYEAGYLNLYDVGYYLVMANVSDIAAMGALPVSLLTVVRYPSELTDQDFLQLMTGIHDAARLAGSPNVGGDIGSAERVILSAAAVGICERGRSLRRDGAVITDDLWVTGSVGRAGAALIYFMSLKPNGFDLPEGMEQELLSAWRRPAARVLAGRTLVKEGLGHACQDVSDGLKATIDELSQRSGVGVVIDESALPIADSVKQVAAEMSVDYVALGLSASVDFELLFTTAASDRERCLEVFERLGIPCFRIGVVTEGRETIVVRKNGQRDPLPGVAWRHQGDDVAKVIRAGITTDSQASR